MPVIIENEYNPDSSVNSMGYLGIDNSWGGGEPFQIRIMGDAWLQINGNVVAQGKAGDPISFVCLGPMYNNFGGGPAGLPPEDYTLEFDWCTFFNYTPSSSSLSIRGGNLKMSNCSMPATSGVLALYYDALRSNSYDVELNNCYFNGNEMPNAVSPNQLLGIRSLDLNHNLFSNCQFDASSASVGVLAVGGSVVLKGMVGNTAVNNSQNTVVFNSSMVKIDDTCYIKTSNDCSPFFLGDIVVDTNALLVIDTGSVLKFIPGSTTNITVKGEMIVDSAVLTSTGDRAYGGYVNGYSSENPTETYAWGGIETDIGSKLALKNHSIVRWTYSPIAGEGGVLLDHSRIEQFWGAGIDMHYTSPCSLQVIGSTIHQNLSTGDGIQFVMSINPADSAAGYFHIDSSEIIQCGSEGIYIGGGVGRSFDDELKVKVTNSVISGNVDDGLTIDVGQPADSITVMNNIFNGNGGNGLWVDGDCDSVAVRVETNAAAGNGGAGLGVQNGRVDFVGNSSVFNSGYGIYYPYKPQWTGSVVNNLVAYNDSYGIYCYARYGGVMPTLTRNIFFNNYDDTREIYLRTDDYDFYTIEELQALGDSAATNLDLNPQLYAVYKAQIISRFYDSGSNQTRLLIDGPFADIGKLEGLPILPTKVDTTAWFYVIRNTPDSIYLAGNAMDVLIGMDSLTVYDYHITKLSPAVEYGDSSFVTSEFDVDGQLRIIDSDGNDIKSVDVGADEFDPDTLDLFIYVTSPSADTTLVPGSTVNIIWASYGIENVKIEYASDIQNGQTPTWQTITNSAAANPAVFSWTVPQTLSYRTRIRVSDAGGSGYSNETDYFHIKTYCLTRVAADSSYEQFAPSSDGWSFSNSTANLWPESWWQQYDYLTGTDPYTGREYPSSSNAYPFAIMSPSAFPSWPIFVEAFGVDQCYYTTGSGLAYVLRAVDRWADISKPFNGSCYGMVNSAALAFSNKSGLATRWGYLGFPDNLGTMSISDEVREFINVSYLHVFGKQHDEYLKQYYAATPKATVEQLRVALMDRTNEKLAALYLANQQGTAAHSVYPYEVASDPNPSLVKVFIYDPNYQGDDLKYIDVDTVNNVWGYPEMILWGGSNYFILDNPINSSLEVPELTSSPAAYAALAKESGERSGNIEIIFPNDGYIAAYDTVGDSIGYGSDGGFNSIANAIVLPTMHASDGLPYRMIVPDQSYRCAISKLKENSARIGYYYDSLYVGYSRADVDSTQVDSLTLDDGLTIGNPDASAKQIVLRMARTLADGERAVIIDSLGLFPDESIRLEPLDTNGWYLDNPGVARSYRFWIRQVKTADGEWTFSAHDIPLEAGVAHILTPHWSGLTLDSCAIYLDYNHDYVADDSMILYNDVIVGVNDDPAGGLPYRFELSQNYPNPFNPVTTIEYSLPQRSNVRIEIFNLLGRKVRTLVEREESAGTYSITWDGESTNGQPVSTGVYFYRFQAGDYVATKKMLLLK
ncbi:MAG: right-handed parallel beta-helix repeat-containing protein [Bacteroidetes bacterium]|nr:right-handed parallel beta-helix repeat-containing protein [Bacteroidota bacterium]